MKKPDIKEVFGSKIKSLRKASKITQADLAAEVDVDVRTIKRIESGNYNPTLEVIAELAKALNVDLSEIFKNQ